jgi:hypothetical protein
MVLMKLQNVIFWSFLTVLNVDLFQVCKACWEGVVELLQDVWEEAMEWECMICKSF